MKNNQGKRALPAILSSVLSVWCVGCGAQRVTVAPMSHFEVTRYMGQWYEIARLDHFFERGLDSVVAQYTLREDGKIDVLNRGYSPSKQQWQEAKGRAVPGKYPNFLKVYFVPLIGGDYQIAYLDSAYRMAVVSGGNTRYLWFLARDPEVSERDLNRMKQVAEELGYNLSGLIYPSQPHATETPVEP